MRSLLLLALAVVVAFAQPEVNRPGDCYTIREVSDCVSTSNQYPINSTDVHCLWCHRCEKDSPWTWWPSQVSLCSSPPHQDQCCLPFQLGRVTFDHSQVCDYRTPAADLLPVNHIHRGKWGRKNGTHPVRQPHGRHLLADGANQITQFIENEIANWPPATQVIAGVVYGSLGSLPNDLNSCLTNAEHLYDDLRTTFENWEWSWSVDVILPEVQSVFEDIEDVVNGAFNDVKGDIQKVISIIKGTTGPIGWLVEAGEIAWNSVNIYQDVSSAVTNFQADRWFDAGYNLGAIVYILV